MTVFEFDVNSPAWNAQDLFIIGFHGLAGSGKDTAANIVADLLPNINERVAFATKMKESVCALLECSPRWLELNKANPDVKIHIYDKNNADWDHSIIPLPPMPLRRFLQLFGTEAHRGVFGDDFWVDQLFQQMERILSQQPSPVWLISDVRFANEARRIHVNEGLIVEILRPGHSFDSKLMQHLSENDAKTKKYVTHTVINDGSVEQLREKLIELLTRISWLRTV